MRFLQFAIPFAPLVGAPALYPDAIITNACNSTDVGGPLTAEAFSELMECVEAPSSDGPTLCLSQFRQNHSEYTIPAGTACGVCYDNFVKDVYADASNIPAQCATDPLGAVCQLKLSYMSFYMSKFQKCAGMPLLAPPCDASTVRRMAEHDTDIIKCAMTMTPPSDCSESYRDTLLTTPLAECSRCYQQYSYDLYLYSKPWDGSSYASDAPLVAECTAEPGSANCLQSSAILTAKAQFEMCSGFPSDLATPVCTADQLSTVLALNPDPYLLFAVCASSVTVLRGFCRSGLVVDYISYIKTLTNADCGGCFDDLRQSIVACDVDSDIGPIAADPYSSSCLAKNHNALIAFQKCAGGPATRSN